jgi:hypothetical protein
VKSGIVRQFRMELNRIELDVRRRAAALNALKEMLSSYENLTSRDQLLSPEERQPKRVPAHHTPGTKAQSVREEIMNVLRVRPMHRKEILDHLASKQLVAGTEQDMNYIASRLSSWPETGTDGNGIWHLRETRPNDIHN